MFIMNISLVYADTDKNLVNIYFFYSDTCRHCASEEKLLDENGVSEYGQYVIPLIAEDVAKYAVVKALMPEVGVKQIDNGEIAYDYDTMMKKGSLRNMGINGDSQEDEANQIVNKIKKQNVKEG